MSALMNAAGESDGAPKPVNVKSLVMDWSGLVALVGVGVSWGMLTNRSETNRREIERLRGADDARAVYDVKIASEMATKSDMQRLSDQIQALSVEFRARAGR